MWDSYTLALLPCAGVVPRSFGIAPEKALKMLVWDTSIRLTNHFAPQCSSTMRWLIAGSAAGAATTVFGMPVRVVRVLAKAGVVYGVVQYYLKD